MGEVALPVGKVPCSFIEPFVFSSLMDGGLATLPRLPVSKNESLPVTRYANVTRATSGQREWFQRREKEWKCRNQLHVQVLIDAWRLRSVVAVARPWLTLRKAFLCYFFLILSMIEVTFAAERWSCSEMGGQMLSRSLVEENVRSGTLTGECCQRWSEIESALPLLVVFVSLQLPF